MTSGVVVRGPVEGRGREILTREALDFLAGLHRRFEARRRDLLAARAARERRLDAGERPDFLPETRHVREGAWTVAPVPADLRDRRVEITGPVERKMMINALNSGAKAFMADFEDSLSPTWANVLDGQVNLVDAVERTLALETPDKRYRLNETTATLLVRPRGWHLVERHVLVDGAPMSASLLDFGLHVFHTAKRSVARGTGPYYYLPKMESHLEARLWNDVFVHAQDALGLPRGTIKATVLVETILAAFEMDEILYELREHSAGLNAGRWDYIFSAIKKFRNRADITFPDRAQITMTVPFMRAYCELLVATCHRRGAHAMGGMSAFIPNRRDPEVTAKALEAVRADKAREAGQGFDGTWVAHPDLVPVAMAEFDRVLGERANQVDRRRDDVRVTAAQLLDFAVPGGTVTEKGLRTNVDVGVRYIESWLRGVGAAAIHNLMEDAATAEISRSQIWQWARNGATLADGRAVTRDLVLRILDEETARMEGGRFKEARAIFESVSLPEPKRGDTSNLGFGDVANEFPEFLTLPAYDHLEETPA